MRTEKTMMVTVEGIKELIKAGYTEDIIKCVNLYAQYVKLSVKLADIQNLLLDNRDVCESVGMRGYAAYALIEEAVDMERNFFELDRMKAKRDCTLLNATKKLLWLSSIAKDQTGVILLTKRIKKDDAEMCDLALSDFMTVINSLPGKATVSENIA